MMQREDLFRIARTQGVSEAGVERVLSNSSVVRMQQIPASLESLGRAPGQRNLWPDRIELGNRGANLGTHAVRNSSRPSRIASYCSTIQDPRRNTAQPGLAPAKILGVQQPRVSLLMRNRAGNFRRCHQPHDNKGCFRLR